ncbi:MAG: hypothetical protein RQ763_08020 [Sulfurimonas sp.]|uniref:hypothetical protein n=1 Tax=Sulfurimonas sp. TaxID=2022749 RepID=UPI0028CFB2A1|nr:hypothetical protein [Sulfurimonas sp.]MDT8339131.1 hypothetical protein [Sulfurimonas sp.]
MKQVINETIEALQNKAKDVGASDDEIINCGNNEECLKRLIDRLINEQSDEERKSEMQKILEQSQHKQDLVN